MKPRVLEFLRVIKATYIRPFMITKFVSLTAE